MKAGKPSNRAEMALPAEPQGRVDMYDMGLELFVLDSSPNSA